MDPTDPNEIVLRDITSSANESLTSHTKPQTAHPHHQQIQVAQAQRSRAIHGAEEDEGRHSGSNSAACASVESIPLGAVDGAERSASSADCEVQLTPTPPGQRGWDDAHFQEAGAAAAAQLTVSPGRTDRLNPVLVGEYQSEIVEYLLQREATLHRDASYLNRQPEITERMRTILVDWLVDVHIKFKLHEETFFLAVDIVDRYLMVAQGQRSTLQLVGIVATLLAAKHEEIYPPEIKDCEYISADTYHRAQILEMERAVTVALNFRFTVPTPYPILCRLLEVAGIAPECREEIRHTAHYLLETAAMDYAMLHFPPSRVAMAALVLGIITFELNVRGATCTVYDVWGPELVYYTHGTTVEEVLPCVEAMLGFARNATAPTSKYQATRRKYRSSRHCAVSTFTLPAAVVPL